MGATYNSFHVLNTTILRVWAGLGSCESFNKYRIETDKKFLEEADGCRNDVGKILKLITSIKPITTTFYLINNDGMISGVSDYLNFSTMKEEMKFWFSNLNYYVLSINCFDDDFLDLSLFKYGKHLTSYITEGARNYDMIPVKFDPQIITKAFPVAPEEIDRAYSDDPEEALNNFSKLFNLPLKLTVLDLIDSKDQNVEKETFYLV